MIDLEELERLAAQATPRPWEVKHLRTNHEFVFAQAPDCDMVFHAREEDVQYITAACNAVPELIAELKEARAEGGELKRHSEWLERKLQLRIDNNAALIKRVRELERQRDYLAKLLGDLCTTQKDGECPLFYACPASGFGWSCGNAIKEDWIYAAEKAAEEAGDA